MPIICESTIPKYPTILVKKGSFVYQTYAKHVPLPTVIIKLFWFRCQYICAVIQDTYLFLGTLKMTILQFIFKFLCPLKFCIQNKNLSGLSTMYIVRNIIKLFSQILPKNSVCVKVQNYNVYRKLLEQSKTLYVLV